MPIRGDYSDIIADAIEQHAYDRPSTHDQLKLLEREIENKQKPRKRPKVRMEPGKDELDYPYTRKYDYVPHGGEPPLSERETTKRYLDKLLKDSDPQKKKMPRNEIPSSHERKPRQISDQPEPTQDQLDESDRKRKDWEIKNKKLVPLVRRPSETLHRGAEKRDIIQVGDTANKLRAAWDDVAEWERKGERMTPSQKFDITSGKVQTVPTPWTPNPTLHRGRVRKGHRR